jgi:hypothetical protein
MIDLNILNPYLMRLRQIESGGDPNAVNKSTGAAGPYQFIGSTAQQYGVTDPTDIVQSTVGAINLTENNDRTLSKLLGRQATPGEWYLAHQQGSGGASALLSNPDKKAVDVLTPLYGGKRNIALQAVTGNGGTADMTAGDFSKLWTDKFSDIGAAPDRVSPDAVTGAATAPDQTAPSTFSGNSGDWMDQAGTQVAQADTGSASDAAPGLLGQFQKDTAASGAGTAQPDIPAQPANLLEQFQQDSVNASQKKPAFAGGDRPPVPQMQGFWRTPAIIGTGLAEGLARTVALPADLMHKADVWMQGILPGSRYAGHEQDVPNPLGYASISKPFEAAGIVNRPDLDPSAMTEGERLTSAVSQGVGASLPFAALGGPLAAARLLASGAGSGAGAYEGGKYYGVPGAIIGGLLGGVGIDVGVGGVGKLGGLAMGARTPLLQSYQDLGISPNMVGNITQNPATQFAAEFAGKMPGGVGRMQEAARKFVSGFGDAVQRTADKISPEQTMVQAGETLQGASRDWITKTLPAKNNIAWAPVNAKIAPDAPVSLDNYRNALERVTSSMAGMPETAEALRPAPAKALLDALNKDVPPGKATTWATAHSLLQHLGDKMGTPEFVASIGQKNLKQLYGSILDDMSKTADAADVLPYFNQARRISTANYAFRDNVLSRFVRASNPLLESIAPENAAAAALKSGSLLTQLRTEMPKATDALAAVELRGFGARPAEAAPEGAPATGAPTSPGKFVTDLQTARLKRPEGTLALYGGNKDVQDLADVAASAKAAQKFANTSGTAGHAALSHMISAGFGGLAAMLHSGDLSKEAAIGLTAAGAVPAANWTLARAVTSPFLARLAGTPSLLPRNVPRSLVPAVYLSSGGASSGQTLPQK